MADLQDLSTDEIREVLRARRDKALCCNDGMCGGCPRCGVDQDEEDE